MIRIRAAIAVGLFVCAWASPWRAWGQSTTTPNLSPKKPSAGAASWDAMLEEDSDALDTTVGGGGTVLAHRKAGVNMGARITAAQAELPGGGTIDARGLTGAQSGNFTLWRPKIHLILGAVTYTGTITVAASDVTISGLGSASVLTNAAYNDLIYVNGASHVHIRGLHFQGQATGWSSGPSQAGVQVAPSSSKVTIERCVFGGTTASNGLNVGVDMDAGTTENRVINNFFGKVIKGDSGSVLGYGVNAGGGARHIIAENIFSFDTTSSRHAIYLSTGASNCIVSKNMVYQGVDAAVKILSMEADPASNHNLVVNNQFVGMSARPDSGVAAVNITGNAQYNRVIANTFVDPDPIAILVLGSATSRHTHPDFTEVSFNTIIGAKENAIKIAGGAEIVVRGNRIHNANARQTATVDAILVAHSAPHGIATTACKVFENLVTGAHHEYALEISRASPAPTLTEVFNNRFQAGSGGTINDGASDTIYGWNYHNTAWQTLDPVVLGSLGAGITSHLSGKALLDFTALAAKTCEVLTLTVPGARDGDTVVLGVPNALADVDGTTERTTFMGWVSSANTVSVRRCNVTGTATADPAPASVRVDVWQH